MNAQPSRIFSFEGYTVRPITEQDRLYLDTLIQGDQYHRDKMDADFFLYLQPGEDAWVLEDERGRVVFYFKTSAVVRMAIQFRETETLADRRRNQDALLKGLRWIEGIFRANRFREVIFETEAPELTVFAKRHLGFVDAPLLSKMILTPPRDLKAQPEALGTLPTDASERGD